MTIAPYIQLMRLDKPIGIWLLFFPAAWAVAFAAADPGPLILLMLLGAALTRAAGCILNDLADRKLDALVERTRTRPLAAGTISVPRAVALLAVLLVAALALALSLPPTVWALAILALPMIAAYPWMKRITWWPQLFLGLTFNLGALMGWAATGQPISLPAFTLYLACVFWTLGYDTIYAVQDMADDEAAGIRSSARRLGPARIRLFVAACYAIMIALLALTAWMMASPLPVYAGIGTAAIHALWQIRQLPGFPAMAGGLFRSNQWLGLMVLLGLLLGRFAG
jgi:4-hydroxybenzoate polyprenyltransferase